MTPREIAGEALLRVERRVSRSIRRAGDTIDSAYISDKDLARSLKGEPLAAVAQRIRERNKPRDKDKSGETHSRPKAIA